MRSLSPSLSVIDKKKQRWLRNMSMESWTTNDATQTTTNDATQTKQLQQVDMSNSSSITARSGSTTNSCLSSSTERSTSVKNSSLSTDSEYYLSSISGSESRSDINENTSSEYSPEDFSWLSFSSVSISEKYIGGRCFDVVFTSFS